MVGFQDRGLAALHDVLRPANGGRGIHGDDLAGHKPIKEHPNRGKCCFTVGAAPVCFSMYAAITTGLICRGRDAVRLAPGEELSDGLGVRGARVAVADIRGEELDEAPGGALAGARRSSPAGSQAGAREIPPRDRDKVGAHGRDQSGLGRRMPNSSGSKKSAGSMNPH